MCKFPVLLVCFVTFVVHAEGQSHPQDATFWKAQTQNEKITYIEGYVKGYFAGRFDMISAFVEGGAKPVTNIAKMRTVMCLTRSPLERWLTASMLVTTISETVASRLIPASLGLCEGLRVSLTQTAKHS